MPGSKTNTMTRKQILDAMKIPPPGGYYVWDGVDEDDRPLSAEELQAGIEAYAKKQGRPAGSNKVSTTIRFDADVLAALKSTGKGWQTRVNDAMREWLKNHAEI